MDEGSETDTSNCTYGPLSYVLSDWVKMRLNGRSENRYLSTMINTGEALSVRIMLPLGESPDSCSIDGFRSSPVPLLPLRVLLLLL